MRAVVQRVKSASVSVDGNIISSIDRGLLILVGFHRDDTDRDSDYIIRKSTEMRIFEDSNDVMNISVEDLGGDILIVSQFTLYGDARKGKRPSYSKSMPPGSAEAFYNQFIEQFEKKWGSPVKTGEFGADMDVSLINDGPITIMLDSFKEF